MHEHPGPVDGRLAEICPAEVARFSRAYQALHIFSNPATGQAAHDCSSHLWNLADAIRRNDTSAIAHDGWTPPAPYPARRDATPARTRTQQLAVAISSTGWLHSRDSP